MQSNKLPNKKRKAINLFPLPQSFKEQNSLRVQVPNTVRVIIYWELYTLLQLTELH